MINVHPLYLLFFKSMINEILFVDEPNLKFIQKLL